MLLNIYYSYYDMQGENSDPKIYNLACLKNNLTIISHTVVSKCCKLFIYKNLYECSGIELNYLSSISNIFYLFSDYFKAIINK